MALTLVEASKGESNLFKRGVIETFIEDHRLLQIIPMRDIEGSADGIEQEAVLPDAATRAVNEAFTPSEGRTQEVIQSLKIYGGDIGIDPFILTTKGRDKATSQSAMKIKAISNRWVTDFFKGDAAADPRDFDGLQLRLDGYNVVSAGTTANGAALSLAVLDEAIARCHGAKYLLMGRQMSLRLTQAMRNVGISIVRQTVGEFGRQALFYNLQEVVVITDNQNNDNVLDFTEAAASGTDTASSIYVIGVGDEGVEGIQNGGIDVRNLGEDNTTPREDTRIEWYNNFHVNHVRSAIRLRNIGDLAFLV
jgi:hypothetical protein